MITVFFRYSTGSVIYAKPLPLATPWGDDVVSFAETGTTGSFSASLDESVSHEIYVRAGGSPASTDLPVGATSAAPPELAEIAKIPRKPTAIPSGPFTMKVTNGATITGGQSVTAEYE